MSSLLKRKSSLGGQKIHGFLTTVSRLNRKPCSRISQLCKGSGSKANSGLTQARNAGEVTRF